MYFRKLHSRLIERGDDSENWFVYVTVCRKTEPAKQLSEQKQKRKEKNDETRVDKQVFLSSVIQTTISRLKASFEQYVVRKLFFPHHLFLFSKIIL